MSLLTLVFFTAFSGFAAPGDANLCDLGLRLAASQKVRQEIGPLSVDQTSYTKFAYPLVGKSAAEAILQRILKDFGGAMGLSQSRFFSQFLIGKNGQLSTIADPTIQKDAGGEIAVAWSQDVQLQKVFQEIHHAAEGLADDLRYSLPETELQLAEVVLTLQINQASENWHLDWYEQEYVIATQTFLAKRQAPDGSLIDEAFAGTEYLLMGDGPEVMDLILHRSPSKIEFMVKSTPPIGLVGKGFVYESPTGLLSVHSGASRVHNGLGYPKAAVGYSLISPPHRGSYKDLVLRASLALRFRERN